MLEKDSGHSDQPQGPQSDKQSIEELYSVPNWEERLEAARAQRERALARHLEAKKDRKAADTPKVAPFTMGLPRPEHTAPTGGTPDMTPDEAPETDVSNRFTALTDRLSRSLLVTMACFASLGFGLAVGLGALVGIGVLRTAPPAETATQKAPTPAEESSSMYAEPAPVVTAALPEPAPVTVAQPAALPEPAPETLAQPTAQIAVRPPVEPRAAAPALLTETHTAAQPDVPAEGALSLVAWLPLQPVVATDTPADQAALPVSPPDPLPGAEWILADKLGATGMNLDILDLRVYAPDAVPAGQLEGKLIQLANTGLTVENVQRVEFAVSTPHIRYYNAEDSIPAQALAEELSIEARDFTADQSGPVGLIEVWFEGVSKTNLAEELAGRRSGTYLFDRLRDKLRSE
ncbi:hypothetical protein [Roseobacter sp. A03A-229]